jgi:hypothetical protein
MPAVVSQHDCFVCSLNCPAFAAPEQQLFWPDRPSFTRYINVLSIAELSNPTSFEFLLAGSNSRRIPDVSLHARLPFTCESAVVCCPAYLLFFVVLCWASLSSCSLSEARDAEISSPKTAKVASGDRFRLRERLHEFNVTKAVSSSSKSKRLSALIARLPSARPLTASRIVHIRPFVLQLDHDVAFNLDFAATRAFSPVNAGC